MANGILPRLQLLLFAPKCWGCNSPIQARRDFCFSCRKEILAALEKSGCLFRYEGAVRGLLTCLRGTAPQLAAAWCLSLLSRSGTLEQWRKMGFHSVVLAPQNDTDGKRGLARLGRIIAAELRIPLVQPFTKLGGRSQHGRSLGSRMDAACFVRLSCRKAPQGKILLIDDVYTTGTTLDQCAYLLRKAGASEVACFSMARQPVPRFERKKGEPEQEGEEMDPLLLHLFV